MAYSIIIITIIFTLHRIGIAAVFWKSWTGFTNIKFRWWSKLFCPRVSFSQLHLQDHKQNYQNQNLTWEHPSVTKSSSIPNDTGQVRRDSRKWDLFRKMISRILATLENIFEIQVQCWNLKVLTAATYCISELCLIKVLPIKQCWVVPESEL